MPILQSNFSSFFSWQGRTTYNDLHIRIARSHFLNHLCIRRGNLTSRVPLSNIVGSQHEAHHVGLGTGQPARQVGIGNVDCQIARVTFVVVIPVSVRCGAVLRVVRHGADKGDVGDVVGVGEEIPEFGAPAGDLSDAVTQGHCEW